MVVKTGEDSMIVLDRPGRQQVMLSQEGRWGDMGVQSLGSGVWAGDESSYPQPRL